MERLPTLPAHPPPREPAEQLGLGDLEEDHAIERETEPLETTVQGLGLGQGPGETIQQKTLPRLGAVEPLGHEADDHVIGNQRPLVHVPLGLEPQPGLLRHSLTQDVPGRDLGHAPLRRELPRLGPLPRAGRAEKDRAHGQARTLAFFRRKPS